MKKLAVLMILVTLTVVGNAGPYISPPIHCVTPPYKPFGSHSLFVGCVSPYDRLLYHQTIVKPGRWFQGRSALVIYPRPGDYRNERISGIWILDNDTNGTGGYPQILQGGVGYKNVSIELSSKFFKGFSFNISIYGR